MKKKPKRSSKIKILYAYLQRPANNSGAANFYRIRLSGEKRPL